MELDKKMLKQLVKDLEFSKVMSFAEVKQKIEKRSPKPKLPPGSKGEGK